MLLYIHIPFCDSKCFYCAFNSYTSLHSYKFTYMESLKKQLRYELKKHNPIIETVFIGGGTPSTIEASEYNSLYEELVPYLQSGAEITIEANPNSATYDWLKQISTIGFNRISFGVQSFDENKLQFLGRNHNRTQAIKAIENAQKVGFKHINCDIIYDTKLDTKTLLMEDLTTIQELPIDHISAYSLTIEEGTKFFNKSSVQIENPDLTSLLFDTLSSMGYKQYEVSNFAKNEEARSKHNLGYWEYKEYLGVGSGAVGCVQNQRFYSNKDVLSYIQEPFVYEMIEKLSKEDTIVEKLLLGFRSVVGVDIDILHPSQKRKLQYLLEEKKLFQKENRVFAKDFLLADELALFLAS